MRNKDRFYESFIHVEHKVMGRKMKRLTLRHRLVLEALHSPVVLGGALNLVHIELASRVCSVESSKLVDVVEQGVSLWDKWFFAIKGFFYNADDEYLKLQAYFDDHGASPNVHQNTENIGESYESFPGILDTVCALARSTGWTPNDIWLLSPGEADWYMAGVFRHRGIEVKVKSEHDEEFEEGLRKEKEQVTRSDLREEGES